MFEHAKAYTVMLWMGFGESLPLSADLPYSWDFLVENLMDPSHVAFSHHGILGKRSAPSSMACTPKSTPCITSKVYMLVTRCAGRPLEESLIMQGCARCRPL